MISILCLVLAFTTGCKEDFNTYNTNETETFEKIVRVDRLLEEPGTETLEANLGQVELLYGVDGLEANILSPGGVGDTIFNNANKTHSFGSVQFFQFDGQKAGDFDDLQFKFQVVNGNQKPYILFQVDLNCDGWDSKDKVLKFTASAGNSSYSSVSINKNTNMSGGKLSNFPNSCLINAVTGYNDLPKDVETAAIGVYYGKTKKQFNAKFKDFVIDFNGGL
jgi:hypothetical protein